MEILLVKRRALFFNNLILLGLDSASFEKKWGLAFHKDMFVVPNKQGFQVITYFLFSELSAVTQEDYKIPWPLITKELERLFQKTCYAHFSSFAQEDVVGFPNIVPSSLSMFGGDRFYEVYLAFSCYVLSKKMEKKGINIISRPSVTRDNFIAAKNVIQLATIAHVQSIKETQRITVTNHLLWVKVVKNLSDSLEKLKMLLKSSAELKEKHSLAIRALLGTPPDEKLQFKKVTEKILELNLPAIRKKLEKFFSIEIELWQHLASEIGEKENQILDGQEFNIELPENLCSEMKKTFQTGITTVEEDGKLSVLRFIKLLQSYLTFISKILVKANLCKLHEDCSVEDVSNMHDSLIYVDKLVKILAEKEIPNLEERIKELKSATCFDDSPSCSSNHCFAIPVQSFSPKAIQERVPHFAPGELLKLSLQDLEPAESPDSSFDLEKLCTEELCDFNLPKHIVPASENTSCIKVNTCYGITASQKIKINDLLSEESLPPISLLGKTQMFEDSIPSESEINLSSLDNVDFGSSSKFSMRDSWLQEQNLHSVTDPNISLDD